MLHRKKDIPAAPIVNDFNIPLPAVIIQNNKDNNGKAPLYGFFSLYEKAVLAKASSQFSQLPGYKEAPAKYENLLMKFLQYIVAGKQKEAEAMLKENPALVLARATVTDCSGRIFKGIKDSKEEGITALQYVEWARDWRMRDMLLKYIDKETAVLQINEVKEKGVVYQMTTLGQRIVAVCEHYFNIVDYLNKLQTYIENYGLWRLERTYDYWRNTIGMAQRFLPACIAQEYCQPDRSFEVIPDFSKQDFVRTLVYFNSNNSRDTWFSFKEISDSMLGAHFAITRSLDGKYARGVWGSVARPEIVQLDLNALRALSIVLDQKFAGSKALLGVKIDLPPAPLLPLSSPSLAASAAPRPCK